MPIKVYDRPVASGIGRGDQPVFNGTDIRCYRMLSGFTADEVAAVLDISEQLVTTYERDEMPVDVRTANQMMGAVDHLARLRENIIARGEKMREELLAGTYVPERRPRHAKAAESETDPA